MNKESSDTPEALRPSQALAFHLDAHTCVWNASNWV